MGIMDGSLDQMSNPYFGRIQWSGEIGNAYDIVFVQLEFKDVNLVEKAKSHRLL